MCGIAGVLDSTFVNDDGLRCAIWLMTSRLTHRGPDDLGIWTDAPSGIAFGHTRLSILDLSIEGKQPMHSENGRYCMVFNGEIYSFKGLRRELEQLGHSFRGHSDTEIMLEAISAWGLGPALARFNGMFAFALWDKHEKVLHLARDRFGEKPLYYGWSKGVFFFASELKALRAHSAFDANINRTALNLYLHTGYVPAPDTIYEGVYKLPPGHTLAIRAASARPAPEAYWSAEETAQRSTGQPFSGTCAEAALELDTLLRDAVGMRMEADVPLGAFLSGGIDSSIVVALMQAQSMRPVKTFTIGSPDADTDEALFARAVAAHLGTEHTELYIGPKEALDIVPSLPQLYDEPFSDPSQIPTFLVSTLARKYVTVALSGDGGDELFGGYSRYFRARRVWSAVGWLRPPWRAGVERAIKIFARPPSKIGACRMARRATHRLDRAARLVAAGCPEQFYDEFTSVWADPAMVALEVADLEKCTRASFPDLMRTMMYRDTVMYLPENILVKLDRASMGTSLETRVPLLDHRIFEFAWRLPMQMKVGRVQGKRVLRHVLSAYVPKRLFERPKRGFAIPVGPWLRGPLKAWAEEQLAEDRLKREGFLNPSLVRQCWDEHTSGCADWNDRLWNLLMFQSWLETQ
jgi:asparagine synthase (glutamine-hydrolysing)